MITLFRTVDDNFTSSLVLFIRQGKARIGRQFRITLMITYIPRNASDLSKYKYFYHTRESIVKAII